MIKVDLQPKKRICQGDIFENVEFIEYAIEKDGVYEISKIVFPLAIVLTQDCDLNQDYRYRKVVADSNHDKHLLSVIVAPIYNAEHVYTGEHLNNIGLTMQTINKKKTQGDYLRRNEIPRYHYLEFPNEVPIVPSIIDFKHYFSINVEYMLEIKETQFICKVSELYRESISQRFSNYLSRIGLPSPEDI